MNDPNQHSNGIHARVIFATTKPILGSINFDNTPPLKIRGCQKVCVSCENS